MIERTGIRIDENKAKEFKKAALENARKHGKEYWAENHRIAHTKIDFNEVDKLCGFK